jgi:endoribonuclease Dicer
MMDGFRKDANYIQTRGRARDANAKFIILVEKDNKTILKSICRAKIAEQLTYSVLKQPTIATAYASNELDENFANQICGNDETPLIALNGGVLYSNGALAVLTRYMRSIGLSPSINFIEEYPVNNWENVVEQVMKNISDPIERASLHHCPELGYVYSILLPLSTENYIKIYGSLRMTKKAARKHAAFISCKYLISNGLLDNNFFPTNNVVKKEMDSSINYFRVPRFLQPEVNGIKRYFLARFKISEFNLDQSWGILTAGKYQNSSADSIKLWIEGKYPCKIELENIDEIVLSNQEFEDLVANQQKIWNFVLNTRINQSKLNIDNNMEMKAAIEYYIVPLLSVSIDWKKIIELNSLLRSMNDYLAENENKDVNDLVIVTKHAGHLYQNLRLSETYSIESFVKTKGKEKTVVSYQNYFSSFGYTEIRNCRLLEASRATPILNCLEQSEKIKHGKVFLPREACQIIPISLSSLQFLKSIPSLMYSLQSIGNISDFVSIFPCIPTKILLPCFYTIAASPEANYEQLETLGDSVLKFIASLSLIIENKYDMASELSKKRSKLVSNRNLYDKAKAMELNCFLQISNFNPTDWYPPIPCAAPILKVSPREVSLKTTADFLESLCGAYFLHGGFSSAWKFLQKCDIVPPQKPLQIDNSPIDCSLYPFLTLIEKSLGYTFEAPVLLLKSISHSSVSQDNYEVLEYLGDAILDIAVVNYYIKKIPNATPGELSNRRSDAVNNVTLAQWVVKIRIHDHIRCNVGIRYAIEKYIGYLNSEDDFIEFEPPKILADVAEAIVGAIYIDSKCNFELTCSIVFPTFQEFLERPINSNDKASRLFSEHACKNQIMADKITYQ